MNKQKIAIIGGGVAAMTSASWLISQPGWRERYDITVYQQGWRLGGKGASGRNAAMGERIEEHGLHVWFGFYVNAFKTLEQVYDKLDRPACTPLATWQDAFKPHSWVGLEENIDDDWQSWMLNFPLLPGNPAEGSMEISYQKIWQFLCAWIIQHIENLLDHSETAGLDKTITLESHHLPLITLLYKDAKQELTQITRHLRVDARSLNLRLKSFVAQLEHDGKFENNWHLGIELILILLQRWLHKLVPASLLSSNATIRHAFIIVDLGLAVLRGVIADDVQQYGLKVLNQYDFKQWLTANGADVQFSVNSAPVRGFYDLAFAYQEGDFKRPNIEAGVALLSMMRIVFCYRGGVMWKMQAGMGDTIFSPIYQLLLHEGVKFEFFNRVDELSPKQLEDGSWQVDQIHITEQVSLRPELALYDPLVTVKDLACWPSQPKYSELEPAEAALLQKHDIDLECFWSDWPEIYQQHFKQPLATKTLRLGVDFDTVIFGASVASLEHLCPQLLALDEPFMQTSTELKAVATQAYQLWLKPTLQEMGWTLLSPSGEEPILTGFSEPFDTWASMDQLLCREDWPADHSPQNAAYFCSTLPVESYPPQSDHDFPAQCRQRAKDNAIEQLEQRIYHFWPNIARAGEFDWLSLLADNQQNGVERFNSQYWRSNVDPSERYVQSVTGSSVYRLATDGTRYSNLYITGDWINTGVNAGCVEAAVMAGMQTSRAISGYPLTIDGEFGFEPGQ